MKVNNGLKETALRRYRSILFVPANRSDRYQKAIDSGADVVVVDLEDAVALDKKDNAREMIGGFFEEPRRRKEQRALRINQCASCHGIKDLQLLLSMKTLPDLLLLPKVESGSDIRWLNTLLADAGKNIDIMALVETAAGLENSLSIAAQDNVKAIVFGTADYSAEIGSTMEWDALLFGRSRIVQAAGANGIAAIDGAWLDFHDDIGLVDEVRKSAKMGFIGKPAIHPKQVKFIHQAFQADEKDLEKAQEIVDAYDRSEGGVVTVGGQMIDAPVVRRAQVLLINNSTD